MVNAGKKEADDRFLDDNLRESGFWYDPPWL